MAAILIEKNKEKIAILDLINMEKLFAWRRGRHNDWLKQREDRHIGPY